ncbi:hypothetical protein NB706_002943 [Xanthomonas sacchari]|nr:hypothetical protein [Xanthomonas sacchari]
MQGVVDLRGGRAADRHRAHHLVQLRLQLRHAADEAVGVAGQRQHRRFAVHHLLRVLGQWRPGAVEGLQRRGHAGFVGVACVELGDGALHLRLGLLELLEGLGVAGHCVAGLVGQLLRQHLQVGRAGAGAGQAVALPGGHAGVGAEHDQRQRQQAQPETRAHAAELAGLAGVRSSTHDATSVFDAEAARALRRRLAGIRECATAATARTRPSPGRRRGRRGR